MRVKASGGGGGKNYVAENVASTTTRIECGFEPNIIILVGQSTQVFLNVFDRSKDATHYTQYWQAAQYTYKTDNSDGGGMLNGIDSTGFNLVSGHSALLYAVAIG